jgi:integrase
MKARTVRHNGKNKWLIETTVDGRRVRRFFRNKGLADTWLANHRKVSAHAGVSVAALVSDPAGATDIAKALSLLAPHGKTLLQAVQEYVAGLEAAGASRTLGEAVDALLEARRQQRRSPRTITELERFLGKMQSHLGGERRLATIATHEIEDWLRQGEFGPTSFNHYRVLASSLFSFATKRGWCPSNPVAVIEKSTIRRPMPEIYSAGQIRTMLATAPGEIRLWVALGAYAGIRPGEMERLQWEDIHIEAETIDLQSVGTKTAQRRQIAIHPVLDRVLTADRSMGGNVFRPGLFSSREFRRWQNGLPFAWIRDGLRHTFATYHLACFGDAGRTALEMGHGGSPAVLFRHYVRPGIRRAEAVAYFGLADQSQPGRKEVAL